MFFLSTPPPPPPLPPISLNCRARSARDMCRQNTLSLPHWNQLTLEAAGQWQSIYGSPKTAALATFSSTSSLPGIAALTQRMRTPGTSPISSKSSFLRATTLPTALSGSFSKTPLTSGMRQTPRQPSLLWIQVFPSFSFNSFSLPYISQRHNIQL